MMNIKHELSHYLTRTRFARAYSNLIIYKIDDKSYYVEMILLININQKIQITTCTLCKDEFVCTCGFY